MSGVGGSRAEDAGQVGELLVWKLEFRYKVTSGRKITHSVRDTVSTKADTSKPLGAED